MAGRALQQAKTKAPSIVVPKTTAETKGDRRIHGLRKALVDGKSERVLRMMGIIHPGDLPRVFPEKKT